MQLVTLFFILWIHISTVLKSLQTGIHVLLKSCWREGRRIHEAQSLISPPRQRLLEATDDYNDDFGIMGFSSLFSEDHDYDPDED